MSLLFNPIHASGRIVDMGKVIPYKHGRKVEEILDLAAQGHQIVISKSMMEKISGLQHGKIWFRFPRHGSTNRFRVASTNTRELKEALSHMDSRKRNSGQHSDPYGPTLKKYGFEHIRSYPLQIVYRSPDRVMHYLYKSPHTHRDFSLVTHKNTRGNWVWRGSKSSSSTAYHGRGIEDLDKYLKGVIKRHSKKSTPRKRKNYEDPKPYTDAELLSYLKKAKSGITVMELGWGFGGSPSYHTSRLRKLVKAGKIKAKKGYGKKSTRYFIANPRKRNSGHGKVIPSKKREWTLVKLSLKDLERANGVTFMYVNKAFNFGRLTAFKIPPGFYGGSQDNLWGVYINRGYRFDFDPNKSVLKTTEQLWKQYKKQEGFDPDAKVPEGHAQVTQYNYYADPSNFTRSGKILNPNPRKRKNHSPVAIAHDWPKTKVFDGKRYKLAGTFLTLSNARNKRDAEKLVKMFHEDGKLARMATKTRGKTIFRAVYSGPKRKKRNPRKSMLPKEFGYYKIISDNAKETVYGSERYSCIIVVRHHSNHRPVLWECADGRHGTANSVPEAMSMAKPRR